MNEGPRWIPIGLYIRSQQHVAGVQAVTLGVFPVLVVNHMPWAHNMPAPANDANIGKM
jgi:hypothetical protein